MLICVTNCDIIVLVGVTSGSVPDIDIMVCDASKFVSSFCLLICFLAEF